MSERKHPEIKYEIGSCRFPLTEYPADAINAYIERQLYAGASIHSFQIVHLSADEARLYVLFEYPTN